MPVTVTSSRSQRSARGTGIIDTIHLVEVTRGISAIAESGSLTDAELIGIRHWFSDYLPD